MEVITNSFPNKKGIWKKRVDGIGAAESETRSKKLFVIVGDDGKAISMHSAIFNGLDDDKSSSTYWERGKGDRYLLIDDFGFEGFVKKRLDLENEELLISWLKIDTGEMHKIHLRSNGEMEVLP